MKNQRKEKVKTKKPEPTARARPGGYRSGGGSVPKNGLGIKKGIQSGGPKSLGYQQREGTGEALIGHTGGAQKS